ncbi:MAG TPA: T9SS type A sorting domain-containing protein [Flavisolibacter sp.]|nr:T9SS type A sorting domain-containing protein [Flavisolibacter sp.]
MKNLHPITFLICLLLASFTSLAQVPIYNSYPSAQATIFIDFDGHLVNGTSWNGSGPINCGPANLSNEQITEVFNRVAEDYRPFNINVTTDSTVFLSRPANRRMRVIVTVTSEWYGAAGGIAYIGSFTWNDNTPAFVFSALLGYHPKKVAEAVSHEAGHTLGLRHQSSYDGNCVKTSEYNPGAGSGEIAWAPIMGISYSRNMTLWNNGANPFGCNNIQDDLGIITSATNGFGYRTDDHGGSAATATPIQLSTNHFNVNGVIERATDEDFFAFTLPATGTFKADAIPYNIGTGNSGSNLDMQVDLMQNNAVVASYNPEGLLSLSIDTVLNAGTYQLRIQGKGNIYAPEYASLGSYSVNASFTPATVLPLRKLELRGLTESSRHRLNWIVDADEAIVAQVLESSFDGIRYNPVASLASGQRTYLHTPASAGSAYYRMQVRFDNGRTHYSNTIVLRNNEGTMARPSLVGNLVSHAAYVNSPSAFSFVIMDYSGRTLSRGNLVQGANTIDTKNLAAGMYIIRYSNDREDHAEKFMRQ